MLRAFDDRQVPDFAVAGLDPPARASNPATFTNVGQGGSYLLKSVMSARETGQIIPEPLLGDGVVVVGLQALEAMEAQGGGPMSSLRGILDAALGPLMAQMAAVGGHVACISHLEGQLTHTNAQLAPLPVQFATLSNQGAALSTQVTNLSTEVAALSNQGAALSTQVTNLSTEVAALSNQGAALSTQMTNLSIQVTNLSTQVTTLSNKVDVIGNDVALSRNYHKCGSSLDEFSIICNCNGALPTDVGLPALRRLSDLRELSTHILDEYLVFYLGGRFHPAGPRKGRALNRQEVRSRKLTKLCTLIGLSGDRITDLLLGRIPESEEEGSEAGGEGAAGVPEGDEEAAADDPDGSDGSAEDDPDEKQA
ncbi:hypothetical protein DFJ74DRAFT_763197 [Hyaloraphidium curvatum]|nr:hypothetical protein DFJ74DRAFT_763197 [Hyaloraphidium curvatum]